MYQKSPVLPLELQGWHKHPFLVVPDVHWTAVFVLFRDLHEPVINIWLLCRIGMVRENHVETKILKTDLTNYLHTVWKCDLPSSSTVASSPSGYTKVSIIFPLCFLASSRHSSYTN